jgi:hypothetical protein
MTESARGEQLDHEELLAKLSLEGFDGVVVSDWSAARTITAANAGLDLVMPGPSGPWGHALAHAVGQGVVSEALIDDKCSGCSGWRPALKPSALTHLAGSPSCGPTTAPARRCAPPQPPVSCSPAIRASCFTPSTSSSPCTRRYPHPGLSRTSRSTRARTERTVRGRPGRRGRDRQACRRASMSRCQRSTVSGCTTQVQALEHVPREPVQQRS